MLEMGVQDSKPAHAQRGTERHREDRNRDDVLAEDGRRLIGSRKIPQDSIGEHPTRGSIKPRQESLPEGVRWYYSTTVSLK